MFDSPEKEMEVSSHSNQELLDISLPIRTGSDIYQKEVNFPISYWNNENDFSI